MFICRQVYNYIDGINVYNKLNFILLQFVPTRAKDKQNDRDTFTRAIQSVQITLMIVKCACKAAQITIIEFSTQIQRKLFFKKEY